MAALPMALLVPAFYVDDLGLPLATVGGTIAVSRLLDVITDPLIGRLSIIGPEVRGQRSTSEVCANAQTGDRGKTQLLRGRLGHGRPRLASSEALLA